MGSKKLLWLLAATALTLVSCGKENIDGNGDDSSSPSTSDVFYSVVSQLVNKNELVGDYSKKTFQPTIGIADGGDESVRVVATNSLEAAVNRYNTLTGASIDTNTVSHTFSDKAVGTLTWSKNTDNKAFGTVTASIPSVPTLQKIIYRAGDQGDTNGKFGVNGEATAYYRFGDVIKRTRKEDGVVEYWVCVRPAFTYEEKEKSHWISVSPLPKDKLWEYYDTGKPFTASNNMDYSLPWKIGTDLEWHQDLAEMLFAIMYPEDWATNIQNYSSLSMFGRPSGLPIFNDWHCDNIKYHNKYFWDNVQKAWKINSIVEKVFGVSFDEMKALLKQPAEGGQGGPGLYLLYDGSYWSTRFSNKPNLYQVHYFHGTKDTKKNMHEKDTDKPCSQVVVPKNLTEGANNYPLDFYKSMTVQKPYIKEQRFFGDDQPRWVVRYAEGKELTEGVYDPMQVMSDFQGDNEVYRYYRDVLVRANLAEPPEVSSKPEAVANPVVGNVIGKDGKFYADAVSAKTLGNGAVAIVVYVGQNGSVESNWPQYKGLAMSLETIQDKAWFTVTDGNFRVEHKAGIGEEGAQELINIKNGISSTASLANGCSAGHTHPAATAAKNYNVAGFDPSEYSFSSWFLPSIGQWILAMQGLGLNWVYDGSYGYVLSGDVAAANNKLKVAGGDFSLRPQNSYHSSTVARSGDEGNISSEIFTMRFLGDDTGLDMHIISNTMSSSFLVCPFIAF